MNCGNCGGTGVDNDSKPDEDGLKEKCQFCGTFEKDLRILINIYSKENGSDTPDFILAEYLDGCLRVYNHAVTNREFWYGRAPNMDGGDAPNPFPTTR